VGGIFSWASLCETALINNDSSGFPGMKAGPRAPPFSQDSRQNQLAILPMNLFTMTGCNTAPREIGGPASRRTRSLADWLRLCLQRSAARSTRLIPRAKANKIACAEVYQRLESS
jgi:hypothetical protein